MTEFKTEKGTTLPLLNLRGKPYLQVAHRLVWFREENPRGIIKTQVMHNQDDMAIVRAEIYVEVERGQTLLVSSAHKTERKENFSDYIEKAETGAIGRALALIGYGTQFTGDELDEGARLADAPVKPGRKSSGGKSQSKSSFRKRVEKAKTSGEEAEDDL